MQHNLEELSRRPGAHHGPDGDYIFLAIPLLYTANEHGFILVAVRTHTGPAAPLATHDPATICMQRQRMHVQRMHNFLSTASLTYSSIP